MKLISRYETLETTECLAIELVEILNSYIDKYSKYGDVVFYSCVDSIAGEEYASCGVDFKSPETDEEYQKRLALDTEKAAYVEKYEREQLAKLKEKYE